MRIKMVQTGKTARALEYYKGYVWMNELSKLTSYSFFVNVHFQYKNCALFEISQILYHNNE